MLKQFKHWLQETLVVTRDSGIQLQLDLATAVLYMEVIRADQQLDPQERKLMQDLLQSEFNLGHSDIQALLQTSEQQAEQAPDLVSFTRVLNQQCGAEQKARIMENLWQLAYADGRLDSHEEHIIRRIADLLYIPHSQFIQAKLKAQD
ncbi:tellurite resistance TerB family protein [Bowmanella pacifica]|uniref:Tellurium resistance terB-like protein subgroup 2 n=1 Tax=Bowmanella pacifica TaxID=502051 RepID=A0A918DMH1_9ALTE|nr:TerB family tellurite resistance protein [Bowmanella pacifica]GGO75009.1 tellurium resistance terB-like protein subgroup 2 [Bowmanella pacifica]